MQTEDDLDLDVETETEYVTDTESETTAGEQVPPEVAKMRKVNREAAALRERAKRAEEALAAEYADRLARFADILPPNMSVVEQIEWVRKAEAKFPVEATSTSAETEEKTPPTDAEKQLATASQGSEGVEASPSELSSRDILAMGKKDPARAAEEIQRYQPRGLIHGPE